eukprot:TRINITY_DN5825_c0_g1_i2.p1 TRINITY_DN5825_c0_g1~~TRINITY_DN5825_c0_g1_i2.p1  ORF type:complete len:441 (-),score=110.82 TRINITY_DN5825_c0_g1_i2:99-1421(-)
MERIPNKQPRPAFNIPEDAEIADPPTPRKTLASPSVAPPVDPSAQPSASQQQQQQAHDDLNAKVALAAAAVHKRSSSKDKSSFTMDDLASSAGASGHKRVTSKDRSIGFANNLMGFGGGNVTAAVDDSKFDWYKSRTSNPKVVGSVGDVPNENSFIGARNSMSSDSSESSAPQVFRRSMGSTDSKISVDDSELGKGHQKKLRVWNSTSTLFVKTTMSKPDVSRSIRCMSSLIHHKLQKTKKDDPISDFDEPDDYFSMRMPDDKHALYRYILGIYTDAQLTIECLVMSLIYLDRLLDSTQMKLTNRNLRPSVLCSLMLSSKVWDDVSMWNVDFCEIYPKFPLFLINSWERCFLNALGFDVTVTANTYASYYFNLREEEIKMNGGLEAGTLIKPLTESQATELEMITTGGMGGAKTSKRERAQTETFDEKSNEPKGERHVLS